MRSPYGANIAEKVNSAKAVRMEPVHVTFDASGIPPPPAVLRAWGREARVKWFIRYRACVDYCVHCWHVWAEGWIGWLPCMPLTTRRASSLWLID